MKQKRKYFVVADVHGFYDEMIAALDAAGFDKDNPNHYFISCGDLFDRGDKACSVLKYILDLPKERRIFIRGNHEDLMDDIFKKNRFDCYDDTNGTVDTIAQLTHMSKFDPSQALIREMWHHSAYKTYRSELRDFFETDRFVFVHGWIPCEVRVELDFHNTNSKRKLINKYTFDENWRQGDWNDARWINGMEAWSQDVSLIDRYGKDIVCGHWHASYGWANIAHIGTEHGKDAIYDTFTDYGITALDACTVLSHKVNCLVCEDWIEIDE